MSAENVARARRIYEEGWNEGRLEVFDELLAPECVIRDSNAPRMSSREQYKARVAAVAKRMSGYLLTIDDIFASGDQVAARGSGRGVWLEGPAAGTATTWTWISIFRFSGGKVVKLWNEYDALGMWQQLGMVTLPPLAAATR
jgi:predicted ester cyclase